MKKPCKNTWFFYFLIFTKIYIILQKQQKAKAMFDIMCGIYRTFKEKLSNFVKK